ncbi:hypothetical protein [Poritiphilus flavus]|uniref:Uncharacterized protein n=1 Tax=Poritiphilus flavus TaxID=2697053 RepID=A0A6L9EHV5_9FLAO|nr:hypothetical protein [Poritiphilus flavus]NAS14311.1 hypothetical protein [Poritiphilus flavus]
MSFTLTYQRLFTVRVKEQTTDIAVRGLRFSPTQACNELLNRYQLVFKERDNGFDIYYKTFPEASVPIQAEITEKIRFSFGIEITDPAFITKYEPQTSEVPQFYLDNLKTDGGISPGQNLTASTSLGTADLAFIKQQSFDQRTDLPTTNTPTEWRLKKKFTPQDVLQTIPIDPPTSPSMPLIYVRINDPIEQESDYIADEGPYLLETDQASPAAATVYLSNSIKQSAANGVLDIYWNNSQSTAPADTGKAYQIILKLK